MRGKANIINSQADVKASELTEEQIIEMATIIVRYDDAAYPNNYDSSLKEGDDGYVEPIYRLEDEIDQGVLDRFGVNTYQTSPLN